MEGWNEKSQIPNSRSQQNPNFQISTRIWDFVMTLLRFFSWRYMRRHPVRVVLNLLSVALGVAIYVSVDVSNTSAEAAFRKTVERLSGQAQLQVIRGRAFGADEEA